VGVASHPCNLHETHHGSKAVFWRQEYTIIHQSDVLRKQCDVVWACFQGSLMVAPLKQSPKHMHLFEHPVERSFIN